MIVTPLREDLITSEQVYLGRAYVVVKNPISLTYFRLSRAHFEAARRFDGKTPRARHRRRTCSSRARTGARCRWSAPSRRWPSSRSNSRTRACCNPAASKCSTA